MIELVSKYQLGSKLKRSVLTRLQNLPLDDSQPFVRVTRDLKRELVYLVMNINIDMSRKQPELFSESAELWKRVLVITDDYFGCYIPNKRKLSHLQSNTVLKVHKLLSKGYIPKLIETLENDLDQWDMPLFSMPSNEEEISRLAAMLRKTVPGQ